MSINVQCPGCGKRYKVDERFAGKKAKCQSCGGAIAVPAAAPKPPPPPPSDDPFAAMDELEQTGTAAPEPARVAAAPPTPAAPAPRRAGTVYNPAVAQPTVVSSGSPGPSQGVKIALSVGVGLVCFVLGFWVVHMLTSGTSTTHQSSNAPTARSVADNSNSGATDDRAIEATGAADIANDLSGGRSRKAPPAPPQAQNTAPPPQADADVVARRPAVLKPFAPDPKQLELLGNDEWLPSVPYVMRFPKNYEQRGSAVFQENSPTLKGYQSYYIKSGTTAAPGDVPMIAFVAQHRQNKAFPKVFTQASSNTKSTFSANDPLDKTILLEGYKVEFGTIDDIPALRAVGKDFVNHVSVVYVLLADDWFMRIDLSNAPPGSAELAMLDTMARTLHYKDPKH